VGDGQAGAPTASAGQIDQGHDRGA